MPSLRLVFALLILAVSTAVARPPNVLLILTDDQGWDDIGLHGNTLIETPHLDALGRAGIAFDRFYSHPVCAPTRASLLTGRHYLRTGVNHVHGGRDFLHRSEITMAQWFKANGYATGMWGKWHSGKTTGYFPWERGFDEAYMARLYDHHDAGGELNGKSIQTPGWTTEALTDMALDFIRRHRDEPFFAYVPHLAPHGPLHAKPELVAKYEAKGLGTHMATAFAMVEMVDASVGRLTAGLEELGLLKNTIVIFLSDNGPQYFGTKEVSAQDYTARYPSALKGHKGSMWENGIRVPFIFHYPERFGPRVVERLADVHDVLPTLIDLCGLQPPEGMLPLDGRSLTPLLEGRTDVAPKQSVIFSNLGWPPVKGSVHPWPDWQREEYRPFPPEDLSVLPYATQLMGLRTERFKLIRNPGYAEGMPSAVDAEVLVDMAADPREDTNLAAAQPALAEVMRNSLAAWFEQIKTEPHAFAPPVFAIGPETTNQVLLYAPLRRLGQTINTGQDSTGWKHPGDGGDYVIEVRQAGAYEIRLRSSRGSAAPLPLTLFLDGQPLLETTSGPTLGTVSLPVGEHVLRVSRGDATSQDDGNAAKLVSLSFAPAAP